MPIRSSRSSRPITLILVAVFAAGILGAAVATGPSVAAAKPRPTPTPTPTSSPIPTPTPTPGPLCTVTGSVTPGPSGRVLFNGLNDVEAISANDIWSVGSLDLPFEHWNGATWRVVADPHAGNADEFYGVTAAASNDAWAVGRWIDGRFGFPQALAEHWDGAQWSFVPGTPSGTTSNLFGVAALASNDVWAVGSYSSQATNNWSQPLVEHWDGTAWHVIPSPSLGTSSELRGVTALAANDIWAVGSTFATRFETLVLHWDGASWTRVASPNVGPYGNGLFSVSAASANDIWAVGEGNNGITLALHWDGSAWVVVSTPNTANAQNQLRDVAARAADDAWAVGFSTFAVPVGEDVEYHDRALLMHWDGRAWSLFNSAAPNGSDNRRNGVDTLPEGEAWVVGAHADLDGTVIERYRCQ